MNDIQQLRQLAGLMGNANPQTLAALRKSLTTSSGFPGINLERTAKLMIPRFAQLRARIPAGPPEQGGPTARWIAQLGFGSEDFFSGSAFGTANGANGEDTTPNGTPFAADYKTQSVTSTVQWEAIQQAKGYDDAMAIDTSYSLTKLMRIEELLCLFANEAALPVPVVSGNYSTVHAISGPVFSNAVWGVKVTAVTGQGCGANASSNSTTGESNSSAELTISVGASGADYLDVSWPYVPGALGYKVYVEDTADSGQWYLVNPNFVDASHPSLNYAKKTSGSFLGGLGDPIVVPTGQTFVTVNHVQITHPGDNTKPTAPVADNSANSNVFEGLTAWLTKNTIYGTNLAGITPRVVIDQGGLLLTSSGTGIAEFDTYLNNQWTANTISPTIAIMSPNTITSVSNRIASMGGGTQARLEFYQERNKVVGGWYVSGYVNKYAASMIGAKAMIDLWAHPYMPDGTILFVAEDVPPETYPYSRQAKAFGLDVQTPYQYFELGRTQRSFPYDVFFTETLKCYHPQAQGAIVGIRVDS